MIKRTTRIDNLEIRAVEVREVEGKPMIRGYAAVFNSPSQDLGGFVEYVRPGAFRNSLKNSQQKAFWNHNYDMVLGSTRNGTLRLFEDETGLVYEIDPPDTQAGRDAVESIRRGDVDGTSFGFSVAKQGQEWDDAEPTNIKRYLTEVDLFEISPVAFPAYPATSADVRELRSTYQEYKESLLTGEKLKKIAIMQMEV
jgi:uncharacterized protein